MAQIVLTHDWNVRVAGIPALAGAAIASKNACVKRGANPGEFIQTAAANEAGRGFLQEDGAPALGDSVTVWFCGVVWAEGGAAIATDAALTTAAAGRVGTAADTNSVVAFALDSCAGAGEYFPVLIAISNHA